MATQIQSVANELRRRLMSGAYPPGERLLEVQLSAELGASRTPVRLAFVELAKGGLLERLATRGFRGKAFDARALSDAIDVRGVLEGMAARVAAEHGLAAAEDEALKACVEEGRVLLRESSAQGAAIDAPRWIRMNANFHATLVRACGNQALADALAQVSRLPLAGAAALSLHGVAPTLERSFIERAQQDHEDIVAAVRAREGARAEALMREHARRSRDNKRELLTGQR